MATQSENPDAPRVLVTRPASDAGAFAAELAAQGMTSVLSPVMEIVFHPRDIGDLRDASLAFTSANGVRAFAASATPDPAKPVYAVGEITAAAARAAGFRRIEVAGGDVDSLAALIARAGDGRRIVHVCGDRRAGDLKAALEMCGVRCDRAALYGQAAAQTLSAAALGMLRAPRESDWVAFFSPRSAAIFLQLAGEAGLTGHLSQISAACLSDSVADASRAGAAWRDVVVAPSRSVAGVVAAIKAARGASRH